MYDTGGIRSYLFYLFRVLIPRMQDIFWLEVGGQDRTIVCLTLIFLPLIPRDAQSLTAELGVEKGIPLEDMRRQLNPDRGNTCEHNAAVRNIDPRSDRASDRVLPSWPATAESAAEAHESANEQSSTRTSRCKRVQDDLMRTWKEARFTAVPRSRSTHPCQAPAPRQVHYYTVTHGVHSTDVPRQQEIQCYRH